jgi:hypothetical protein
MRGRLVRTGLIEAAETGFSVGTIGRNVDDILQLIMIEEESELGGFLEDIPVNRAVPAAGKGLAESLQIQSLQPLLPLVDPAKENDLTVVIKEIDDLLVQTFIEVITIYMLQITDCLDIRRLICERLQFRDLRFQCHDFAGVVRHLALNLDVMCS